MKYVARCTNHPAEDLQRNWSAPLGGIFNGDFWVCETIEEAREMWENYYGEDREFPESQFRFHPAYDGIVQVDYEGLGAWELDAETLEEAIAEAIETFGGDPTSMACVMGRGTGHFYASQCEGYYETGINELYIFAIN